MIKRKSLRTRLTFHRKQKRINYYYRLPLLLNNVKQKETPLLYRKDADSSDATDRGGGSHTYLPDGVIDTG